MNYKELDINSICTYLQAIKEIKEFFGDDDIKASEIGDGNLNYVYLIQSIQNPKKALIAKQAVPYLRCVGEEFALSKDRMNYEIRALQEFKKISPQCIPNIYYASEEMSLLVMQYLDKHTILRTGIIEQNIYPKFNDQISSYLANVLFHTSSLYLQSKDKKALISKFNDNTELCKLTEDFVFTFAFMDNETNDNDNVKDNPMAKKLFSDMAFKQKVLELKYKFMTQNDALLHGDLHTGSIMLNQYETYVIDPEFAFVGPFGFDIGALIANIINNYIHHHIVTKNQNQKKWLLDSINEILTSFEAKFVALWDKTQNSSLFIENLLDEEHTISYKKDFMKNILQQSIGFAGCKMARRVFGVAGVQDIRGIKDKALKSKAEKMAIDISRELVINYDKIENIKQIITIIKDKSER